MLVRIATKHESTNMQHCLISKRYCMLICRNSYPRWRSRCPSLTKIFSFLSWGNKEETFYRKPIPENEGRDSIPIQKLINQRKDTNNTNAAKPRNLCINLFKERKFFSFQFFCSQALPELQIDNFKERKTKINWMHRTKIR